jgi:hypothetical protein
MGRIKLCKCCLFEIAPNICTKECILEKIGYRPDKMMY